MSWDVTLSVICEMFSHFMMSGRWGSLYKPLCRYPREPSKDTSLTLSAFWARAATSYIWEGKAKKFQACLNKKLSSRGHLIRWSCKENAASVYTGLGKKQLSALLIPAEQPEWEPSDRPLNEEKVLGFSFSSDCRNTKSQMTSLYISASKNILTDQ